MDDEPQSPDTLFHTAVGVEGGLGVLALVLGYVLGPDARELVPSLEQLPALLGGVGLGILATFPLLLLMAVIRRIKHPAVEQLDQLSEHPMIEMMLKLGPVELLVISLCAGVGEELLFRGWLMPALANVFHGETVSLLSGDPSIVRPWWAFGGWTSEIASQGGSGLLASSGPAVSESAMVSWSGLTQWWSESVGWEMTVAWILSSISFGFVHPISKLYIAVTGLMGLYFGVLLILTGNLMIPIIAHALYDAIQLWSASAEEASKSAKST
ncbi:CPBP family intramembrane glutamic endopeptidase [Aporhodopirellula aestuarii]|uniref:CPBP family intramembrane metalloprotease n=1 Tax=Aporhodopirellula aestuarii TaxID=2950107 RepID=A0ABT0U4R4_9BACT|nr:CPBP family intramembrane glutamic endopeptidase [Aporhodopirellula aestuarii]MCM2371679.1 CPBP family intramembrane metalloprotease [Aporhodopirellula aestuarii]